MNNPFDNLIYGNPGEAFNRAFQQGQAARKEAETQNAMMAYAQNPDDPKAIEGLARYNPEMAIKVREQQQSRQQAMLEQHRENIVKGAQIIRQFGVKDEQSYQAALNAARQLGIDLSEVPPNYDPQYVQGLVSIADSFAPQKGQEATALQRDYEFLQQQNPQLAEQYLRNKAEGAPLIASNGDGTFTIIPRGMANGQQGGVPPLPPGFVLDNEGGPTDSPSGNFPR